MFYITTNTGLFQLPFPRNCSGGGSYSVIETGDSFDRHIRREIDRLDFAYINIEADPTDTKLQGARPGDFHGPTLNWAMRSATLVVVWAGSIPHDRELLTRTLEAHACPRGRIVLALVREEYHHEWSRFVDDNTQPGAELLLITPAAISTTQCQTSGAVH